LEILENKYFVYILQSLTDNSFYIGYTTDIDRRLEEHNSGISLYTSRKIPWRLVYKEEFLSKTDALKRERFLKKQKSASFINQLINEMK